MSLQRESKDLGYGFIERQIKCENKAQLEFPPEFLGGYDNFINRRQSLEGTR